MIVNQAVVAHAFQSQHLGKAGRSLWVQWQPRLQNEVKDRNQKDTEKHV